MDLPRRIDEELPAFEHREQDIFHTYLSEDGLIVIFQRFSF